MSRIGKKPVVIPKGVTINLDTNKHHINVKGPKGSLNYQYIVNEEDKCVDMTLEDNQIIINRHSETKKARSRHGLVRALVNNMVVGVSTGFTKKLMIVGTGYRASLEGKKLVLNVGYSLPHPLNIPEGIEVEVDKRGVNITISGCDRQVVGQFAAEVREERPPEPYKQKGIRYVDEYIQKKQGKRGT